MKPPSGESLVPVFSRDASVGLNTLVRTEWFLTNGLGGFAQGTASGLPTRRYHAWLNAATKPPVGRVVALTACAEWLSVLSADSSAAPERHDLSSFHFAGGKISPEGLRYLVRFEKDVSCRWTYRVGRIDVVRELVLCRGDEPGGARNAIVVRYRVRCPKRATVLEIRPLTALRDFHAMRNGRTPGEQAPGAWVTTGGGESLLLSSSLIDVKMRVPGGTFVARPETWRGFEYPRDTDRGQDGHEDLASEGVFEVEPYPAGDGWCECEFKCWTDGPEPGEFQAEYDRARAYVERHAQGTLNAFPSRDPQARRAIITLAAAAQQFVVRRESVGFDARGMAIPAENLSSVIAGYPWFSDWGRDTMICIPGLLLATGRIDEARRVLETFAAMMRRGLIPNCFNDGTGEPEYNTVDAPLWYLHAACRYAEACRTPDAIAGTIMAACMGIIDAYRAGTDHDIRMDAADGLIAAGDHHSQLTWMDAKRNGVVFTPRFGKPVEINALWYSGLRGLARLLSGVEQNTSAELDALATRVATSFRRAFFDPSRGCLFDVLVPHHTRHGHADWIPDAKIRPNQIFAVSLPDSPLDAAQQRSVLACVRSRLLTPMGLRTLDPEDPGYKGRFEGDLMARDGAYHNGTVWPWLIGPYAEAVLRVGGFSAEARAQARSAIAPLMAALDGFSSGQLAEIFDGDGTPEHPQRPDGCFAQAWSIAELLRVNTLLA
jgi:glycogen debranching enzyme